MRTIFLELKKSPIFLWIVAFVIMNLLVRGAAVSNPYSRYMTMRAMTEKLSFEVSEYKDWTADWSRTPDGRYFSNKAPGPMFIGFPLFWVMEQVTKLQDKGFGKAPGERDKPGPAYATVICLFTQVLPFVFLAMLVIGYMQKNNVPKIAQHFTALALLFGNTADIFMNSYFGHGMTAVFVLATVMAFLYRRFFLVGLFFGFSLLCEYSAALLFPALVIAMIWQNKKDFNWLKWALLGGLLPAALWIWYHVSCFGSPFLTSVHFQNPIFVDQAHVSNNLMGVFNPFPPIRSLYEVVLGPTRGILFTQPWALLLIPALLFFLFKSKSVEKRQLALYGFSSMILLIWMNASFGAWHAGGSSGPRYICLIFPVMAMLMGLFYSDMKKPWRITFWILLLVAVVFRGLVYATMINAGPSAPIWIYLGNSLLKVGAYKFQLRFVVYWVILGLCFWQIRKKQFNNNIEI